MKVRCKFCEFLKDNTCSKKRNVAVRINKPRMCSSYKEDGLKVFDEYRRKEKAKADMARQQLRREQAQKVMRMFQEELAARKAKKETADEE